jgi:hypothetical protein
MRLRSALTMLLLAGLGFGLSACYYPGPGYYDSGYYGGAPAYYSAPAYYGPSVGVYYGGGYGGGWHRDRWH